MGKVEEVEGIKSVNQIPMMMRTCQMTMIKARQECPNLSIPDLAYPTIHLKVFHKLEVDEARRNDEVEAPWTESAREAKRMMTKQKFQALSAKATAVTMERADRNI